MTGTTPTPRRRGFCQYQFIVPTGNEEEFTRTIEHIQASGHVSFLNVIKLFGDGNKAPLSFPFKGWNVCVDFPVKRGLAGVPHRPDQRVGRWAAAVHREAIADVGGELHKMPPAYRRSGSRCAGRIDPNRVFMSDMGRRPELA